MHTIREISIHPKMNWVRSEDGIFAGVCSGIATRLDWSPWTVRLLWILSVAFAGFGIGLYLILALTLPKETEIAAADQRKFLGVCRAIAHKTEFDLGLVRAATVILALGSLGVTLIGYMILYFILDQQHNQNMY